MPVAPSGIAAAKDKLRHHPPRHGWTFVRQFVRMYDMSGKNHRGRAAGRISIRVPSDLRLEIRSIASGSGRRESAVVRDALKEYVEMAGGRATCLELARKAGLIGMVKDLPRDLSTHRRHFGGFGQ